MEIGAFLTEWSVRLAVGCYAGRLLVQSASLDGVARFQRALWTCGLAFYLLHVAFAFQFYHGWSHRRAYRHTAEQTAAVTGIEWGGGLYVNYVFTLVWIADVLQWWLSNRLRHQYWEWIVQTFFAFVILNATVVFGPAFWKPIAVVVVGLLLFLVWDVGRRSS